MQGIGWSCKGDIFVQPGKMKSIAGIAFSPTMLEEG